MTEKFNKQHTNSLVQFVRNLFSKILQPDIYPIRYYKKGKRFRRY